MKTMDKGISTYAQRRSTVAIAAPGLASLRMIRAISGSPRLLNHRLNAMNGKSDQATLIAQ